eukprot:12424323-Karenia_brevis.AAC.1
MYRKLNNVYMRVLRRIAGACRYDKTCKLSDSEVRRLLDAPSLQCLIMRRRLMLLAAVVKANVLSLLGLLSVVSKTADELRLPWTRFIVEDMKALQEHHAPKLDELGDPATNSVSWHRFLLDYPHQF